MKTKKEGSSEGYITKDVFLLGRKNGEDCIGGAVRGMEEVKADTRFIG